MKLNNMFCFLLLVFFVFFLNINFAEASALSQAWTYKGDPTAIKEPSIKSNILIVNKNNPLPKDYTPAASLMMVRPPYDLAPEASAALTKMLNDAKSSGHDLSSFSGYRDYAKQSQLYNDYVSKNSQSEADKFSARPGYSEHQTGMAFDLKDNKAPSGCEFKACGNTAAMNWVKDNAHKYGFILRFTDTNSNWTGYQSEFWHYRYIGEVAAKNYKSTNALSLEQFAGMNIGETIIPGINSSGSGNIVNDIKDNIQSITNGTTTVTEGDSEFNIEDYTQFTDKDLDISDLGNVGVNTKKNYDSKYQEYRLNGFMKFILSTFHTISLGIAIIVFGYVSLVWMLILLARTHMAPIEEFLRRITFDSVDPHEELGKVIKNTIIIMFFVVIAVSGLLPLVFAFIYELIIIVLDYIKYNTAP